METEQELNFAKDLILFYKEFTAGNAKAITLLADLQEKYPEQYKRLQEVNNNPETISDMALGLPSEAKDAILLILLKASKIGRKSIRLFDMNISEQREYAKELVEYAEFVERKANELDELRKKQTQGNAI